jgi:hypothetical protein
MVQASIRVAELDCPIASGAEEDRLEEFRYENNSVCRRKNTCRAASWLVSFSALRWEAEEQFGTMGGAIPFGLSKETVFPLTSS